MKEQIQQLIAAGQTEEALQLLVNSMPDAILLQARYNQGKKQYNMGLIEFGEWSRIQAQINYAALELSGSAKLNYSAPINKNTQTISGNGTSKTVFISYNQQDVFAMRAVRDFLEDNGIKVTVDAENLSVGRNIEDFIDQALKDNQFILSIVSEHSLKSGWVNKELSATLLLSKFDKKWLPVLLDHKSFERPFYNQTMDEFDLKIKKLQKELQVALKKGRDIRAFTDELERLQDLRNDFAKTIQALKNHYSEDISGNLFDFGMGRVLKAIQA